MAEARFVRSSDGEVYEDFCRFKHGSLTGGTFDFMGGEIGYLEGPPLHVHEQQDDTFCILEGVLSIQVGDEISQIGPGDFASVLPGVLHTFANTIKDQPPVKAILLAITLGTVPDNRILGLSWDLCARVGPADINKSV